VIINKCIGNVIKICQSDRNCYRITLLQKMSGGMSFSSQGNVYIFTSVYLTSRGKLEEDLLWFLNGTDGGLTVGSAQGARDLVGVVLSMALSLLPSLRPVPRLFSST